MEIKIGLWGYYSQDDVVVTICLDGEMGRRAVSDDPDDLAVGLEQPCVLLVVVIQLKVIEEVAQEFCPLHAEGLEAVALSPMAQHDATAIEQSGVECDANTAVTHLWLEWCAAVLDGEVDGAIKFLLLFHVDWNFDAMVMMEWLDVKRLSVDGKHVVADGEMRSAVPLPCGLDGLAALVAIEAQMADAMVEQGRGVRVVAKVRDVDGLIVVNVILGGVFKQLLVVCQVVHRVKDPCPGIGEVLFEEGQDGVADAVASVVVLGIGAVGDKVLSDGGQIVGDIASCNSQQRPPDALVESFHPSESSQSGATHEVEEKGLHLVVGMVGYGDEVIAVLIA